MPANYSPRSTMTSFYDDSNQNGLPTSCGSRPLQKSAKFNDKSTVTTQQEHMTGWIRRGSVQVIGKPSHESNGNPQLIRELEP